MCKNNQSSIAIIQNEAISMADELIGNNLDRFSKSEFQSITNRIFEHVNIRIANEYKYDDSGDSGENAQREIRICRRIAEHINEKNFSSNRIVEFDATNFKFIYSNN